MAKLAIVSSPKSLWPSGSLNLREPRLASTNSLVPKARKPKVTKAKLKVKGLVSLSSLLKGNLLKG